MNLNELNSKEELMVDLEELEKQIDSYFENISKEELITDLEKVGLVIEEIEN